MPEEGNWTHYLAYSVQVFEMTSLFVLFLHFYFQAYRRRTGMRTDVSSEKSSADSDSTAEQVSISSASASLDEQESS